MDENSQPSSELDLNTTPSLEESKPPNKFNNLLKIILFAVLGGLVVIAGLAYSLWQILFSGSVTQNPDTHSGEMIVSPAQYNLPETGGIENFSVSPDGKWLFITADDAPGEHQYYRYILHDIETGQGDFINDDLGLLPETFFDTQYPLLEPGCWDIDSRKVTLVGRDVSTLYSLAIDSSSSTWKIQKNADDLYDYYYNCPTRNAPYEVSTLLKVHLSDKSIELTTTQAREKTLARHKSNASTVSRVSVSDIVVSPDGQYVSYVFDQYRGNFVAPSQGYVVNLAGESRLKLLGSPIYEPFYWSADSMYVYAIAGGNEGQGIYRWQIQDRPSASKWKAPVPPELVTLNEEKVFSGQVIENHLGCHVDGECYLKIKTQEGQKLRVIYHYGERHNCINDIAANTGEAMAVGDNVVVFGRIIADFDIHTCPSEDFYIRKLIESVPVSCQQDAECLNMDCSILPTSKPPGVVEGYCIFSGEKVCQENRCVCKLSC